MYSRSGIGSATTSNDSAVSTQGNNNVGVTQGRLPTSDTTSVSVTKSVAQPAENVKKLNLPKGTIVDVSIVGDNSNIIQVKFNGEQGKGKKASRFQDIVKRRKNAMSLLICRVMSCWG